MRLSTFKFQVIILLLGLAHGQLYAQPTPPEGKKWVIEKSLSDEFNGSFDTNKWSKSTWNYKNTPCEMVTQNAGVSDGNLWIKATLSEKDSLWFKTARVQSKSKISFPMYTECRIKAANISAYTTYWLNNGNANSRDEIDICENNPKPSIAAQTNIRPYTLYSQYFIVKNGVTERNHSEELKRRPDTRNLSDKNPAKGKKWNEDYQVLGCYWKDSKNVQFYINGEPAGSTTSKQDFSLDLNIIWDLWTGPFDYLGGEAIKKDLLNPDWNTMYVDWIHTYTLENAIK